MSVIEKNLDWGLKILCDMISIPTINPPGENFDRFAKYASDVLKGIGMDVEIVEVPREFVREVCRECNGYGRYIVVGRVGAGKPVIQFNGHYDVVPPGSGWNSDPFRAIVSDGKVFGRGSVDMKGGIVSTIIAVKSFLTQNRDFKGTVEVALVPDEEIGGTSGTGYLVKNVSRPDYVIIAEPSGSRNIWIGHKGAIWGYIEIFGRQAHGSTPWRGVNAFEYMAKVAIRFLEKYRNTTEGRISSYDYGDPNGARPTISIGGEVRGSTKINIVPGYYAFSFDRRVIPEEDVNDVEKEIVQIVKEISEEFTEISINTSITNILKPALTRIESPLIKNLEKAIENTLGLKPKLVVCLGGLDLHYYTEQNIDAVAYGPGPEEVAHMVNEYVLIKEIESVTKVYTEILKTLPSTG